MNTTFVFALVLALFGLLGTVAIVAIALGRRRSHDCGRCHDVVVHPGAHNHPVAPHEHTHTHPASPIQTDDAAVRRIVESVLSARTPVVPAHNHNPEIAEIVRREIALIPQQPAQFVQHLHRHVGRPFSRIAAIVGGAVMGVVLGVVLKLIHNSVVTLVLKATHTDVIVDHQLSSNIWLKGVIWVLVVSLFMTACGYLVAGFRGGDQAGENQ